MTPNKLHMAVRCKTFYNLAMGQSYFFLKVPVFTLLLLFFCWFCLSVMFYMICNGFYIVRYIDG